MKSKNKLQLTFAIVVMCLVGLGYAYNSINKSSAIVSRQYSKLLAESEILDLQIANSQQTNAAIQKISDVEKIIPNILPPTKVQSDIVAQILSNGSDNGINIDSIDFPTSSGTDFDLSQTEPLEGVPGVNTITTNINFNSSFSQMLNFIESLEKNQRISQVENISITPLRVEGTETAADELSVVLQLNLYVRK